MKKILSAVLEAGVLLCCLSIVLGQTPQKPLENVLTLELSFGDKDVPDEYLLVEPKQIAIDAAGNIFVCDENRIKVYDKNGKPKTIVGRPGEGPGEFNYIRKFTLGPSGFLSVIEVLSPHISLFSQDFKFIYKENFNFSRSYELIKNNYALQNMNLFSVVYLNRNERILYVSAQESNFSKLPCEILVYEKEGETPKALVKYIDEFYFIERWGNRIFSYNMLYLSNFFWQLIPNNKIIYVDIVKDNIVDQKTAYYSINKIVLTDSVIERITHQYQRTPILYEQYGYLDNYSESPERTAVIKKVKKAVEQEKYNRSLQGLLCDRDYVFTFAYTNKNGAILTDVFDVDKKLYIVSVFIPGIPKAIFDGYAYYVNKSKDGFPVIQKYRIDPRVYGK
jgi:hypothetical protein